MAGSKKVMCVTLKKNEISVICVTNIAGGKNVWNKNIILDGQNKTKKTRFDRYLFLICSLWHYIILFF